MVTELRCTSCNAPVDLSAGALQSCRYCGAALVVQEAKGAKKPRTRAIVRTVVVLTRCGPSNYERVEKLLRARGVKAEDASACVRSAPCELPKWDQVIGASELVTAIEEAGAQARVEECVTHEPLLPDVRIVLEDAGTKKAAVMRAIRAAIDLGLDETKALVARTPVTVADAIEGTKGRTLHAALLAAGARATMTELD